MMGPDVQNLVNDIAQANKQIKQLEAQIQQLATTETTKLNLLIQKTDFAFSKVMAVAQQNTGSFTNTAQAATIRFSGLFAALTELIRCFSSMHNFERSNDVELKAVATSTRELIIEFCGPSGFKSINAYNANDGLIGRLLTGNIKSEMEFGQQLGHIWNWYQTKVKKLEQAEIVSLADLSNVLRAKKIS